MTNIGVKPTVDYGGAPLAETYIHGFTGDLYGTSPEVVLLRFIRPERRFGSTEELKKQIAADVSAAVEMP
jgi:riboflavin kinase/FMN adenylyltransferase